MEGGAYLFAIEANGANRYHALLFVMTIIAAVAARAIFCATNVLPETRAVLLKTFCPPATAALVTATTAPALLCKAIGGVHHRGFAQHRHLFGLVCAAQGDLSDESTCLSNKRPHWILREIQLLRKKPARRCVRGVSLPPNPDGSPSRRSSPWGEAWIKGKFAWIWFT